MTKTLVFTSLIHNWLLHALLSIGKFEFRICFGFRASDFGFNITQKAPETVKPFHFSSAINQDGLITI